MLHNLIKLMVPSMINQSSLPSSPSPGGLLVLVVDRVFCRNPDITAQLETETEVLLLSEEKSMLNQRIGLAVRLWERGIKVNQSHPTPFTLMVLDNTVWSCWLTCLQLLDRFHCDSSSALAPP